MKEIFKPIEGFSLYEVSNYGNVRNCKTGKLRKFCMTHNGYYRLGLTEKGKQSHFFVKRLVADQFLKGKKEGLQINHIDGIKTNNNVSNLEWVTPRDNSIHSYENGLSSQGEKHYRSFLTEDQAREIFKLSKNGVRNKDIASRFGISSTLVCNIKFKRNWKHIHKSAKV